jgi:hypothetical protein
MRSNAATCLPSRHTKPNKYRNIQMVGTGHARSCTHKHGTTQLRTSSLVNPNPNLRLQANKPTAEAGAVTGLLRAQRMVHCCECGGCQPGYCRLTYTLAMANKKIIPPSSHAVAASWHVRIGCMQCATLLACTCPLNLPPPQLQPPLFQ